MDIILERILSLIPQKEDGKPVHGEAKKFAQSIGYDSGAILTLWKNGTSDSYKNKLYEISTKYNVSVEWLKGETDEKNPPASDTPKAEPDAERTAKITKIMSYAMNASDEKLAFLESLIDNITK